MARPKNNYNPFALIDDTPSAWKGLVGKTADGFLIFDSPQAGVRAGFINLVNVYLRHGLNTIEKIFPVYAPKGHGSNDPEAYIKHVVSLTGIQRNQKISTFDQIYKLGKAIVTHEEGYFWVSQNDFNKGFDEAMKKPEFDQLFSGGLSSSILMLLILILTIIYLS